MPTCSLMCNCVVRCDLSMTPYHAFSSRQLFLWFILYNHRGLKSFSLSEP
uniref:Uncharacterized protein n=1 Tax=Arundo donax TaxID=35708 RepID=A0A0A9ACV4_ARUDO